MWHTIPYHAYSFNLSRNQWTTNSRQQHVHIANKHLTNHDCCLPTELNIDTSFVQFVHCHRCIQCIVLVKDIPVSCDITNISSIQNHSPYFYFFVPFHSRLIGRSVWRHPFLWKPSNGMYCIVLYCVCVCVCALLYSIYNL